MSLERVDFRVVVSIVDDRPVLEVHGELDCYNAPKLGDYLDAVMLVESARDIAVDLHHVTFIDSSGIRCLVRAAERMWPRGGSLEVRRPSRSVARLFELAGVGDLVPKGVLASNSPDPRGGRLTHGESPTTRDRS